MGFFTACGDNYEYVEAISFNREIAGRADLSTPEELIKAYYNFPENEGNPNLEIRHKEIGEGLYKTTLIHDGMEDDSQRAIKIVMIAKKEGKQWSVVEIKKSRKCWDGRGHTNWGAQWCN